MSEKLNDSVSSFLNSVQLHFLSSSFLSLTMDLEPPFPQFQYHPHQEEGIRWMINQEINERYCCGGILADEMGLGKTWQTIGLLLNNPVPYTLLLVPPVLQAQWSDVLGLSEIPHILYTNAKSPTKIRGIRRDVIVVLMTYDRAARHAKKLCTEYDFDRIVCDEGHIFRNGPRTKRFQEIVSIPAKRRWLLTGTPIQNRIQDFKHLLNWLDACYDLKYDTMSVIAEGVMLRRTVSEVRDVVKSFPELKPRHYIHPVTMPKDSDEKRVFDILVNRFTNAIDMHVKNWLILELYLRIRQFLAHPQIYKNAMAKKYPEIISASGGTGTTWDGTASKMTKFGEFMFTATKIPTLIFTTFTEEMTYAEQECKKAGYLTWRICGGIGATGIDKAIRDSREAAILHGKPVAVLVQIQAGNAGINLQHLSRVVFLSSHWNPAIVDQAIGRSYRIGQTKPVEVHHILLADGAEKNLDRHMAGLHLKKRSVAKRVCKKLVCDSAADVHTIFEELNAICPDEIERFIDDKEEESIII